MQASLITNPGSLIQAMRIYSNMNQQSLAERLNISKHELALLESNEQSPSLDLWCHVMDHFGLPIDASRYGYIDFESIISIRSGIEENGFLLPLRYSQRKCIKVRELLPLLNFTANRYGEKILTKIMEDLHVSPLFFHILDNQINVFFLADFLEKLQSMAGVLNTDYANVADYFANEKLHGSLAQLYRHCTTEKELVQTYLSELDKYERVFKYDLEALHENNALLVHINYNSAELEDDLFEAGAETQVFLDEYREAKIMRLSQFPVNKKEINNRLLSLSEVSSVYKGDSETVYKIEFSA